MSEETAVLVRYMTQILVGTILAVVAVYYDSPWTGGLAFFVFLATI